MKEEINDKYFLSEKFKKSNKVRKLKLLCSANKRISFIVETPGTGHERPFHVTSLVECSVSKTKDGNYVITGVDVEYTLSHQHKVTKKAVLKCNFENKIWRRYRVDRILDGTIMFN